MERRIIMLIDFSDIREITIPGLNGGEGAVAARMAAVSGGKIMMSRLPIGASIGNHCHTAGSELDYVLRGSGTAECDGEKEKLTEGTCHFCPKGSAHSISNTGEGELVLFTVVTEE